VEEKDMETLKERILAAEWAGYHWAKNHPGATAEQVAAACQEIWPESSAGVLIYAFERGWAMSQAGKAPEPLDPGVPERN
jgi:hypothetical protein